MWKKNLYSRDVLSILTIFVVLLAIVGNVFALDSEYVNKFRAIRNATDFDSIQAAVDDLPVEGGIVFLSAGTYDITSPIILRSNVALVGEGKVTKITTTLSTDLIRANGATGVLIEKLYLYGTGSGGGSGISLQSCGDCMINKVWSENNGSYGIYSLSSSGNTMSGNNCHSNQKDGIHLVWGSNNTLSGNSSFENQGHGIYSPYGFHNNTLSGNICYANQKDGIRVNVGNYNTINNNRCYSNQLSGIHLQSCLRNTLSNNIFYENKYGVSLHFNSRGILTGNSFRKNQYCGIFLSCGTIRFVDLLALFTTPSTGKFIA